MTNNILKSTIQATLDDLINVIEKSTSKFNMEIWKITKSKLSSSKIAEILGISVPMLAEFEETLKHYYTSQDNLDKERIVCLRISLWLETIAKNINIPFAFDLALTTEETAIKQVRALELIIRDVITEQLGGSDSVIAKLQDLFKQDVIDKWIKSADNSGILSGTTFSELSNILLDKNIFQGIEEIFKSSNLELTKSTRDSLRYILEDIRIIRNSIAHNKKVSNIQIEALNEYYKSISTIIKNAQKTKINPDTYLDMTKLNMEEFISTIKQDNQIISGNLEIIKEVVVDIKSDTASIKKRNTYIIIGVAVLILLTTLILYFQHQQAGNTSEIGKDLKDVKQIVSGDAELKNMSSTDDLTATKDLNARTKDINAKRVAIIYFENSSDDPSLNKLKKGLADMMITDLSNINMLNIVERDRLEAILKEQKLSRSSQVDPATAAKVGKLLGAQVILTGGYFEMMGSLRIDARFIDVETGKILKSDGVDGAASSFFKIQKQLSWKIIKNLDTKISDKEKADLTKLENSKNISLEDTKIYSEALDLYDNGKLEQAKTLFDKLITKYPDFQAAKNSRLKIK
jgi:TolB-like protein